MSTPSVNPYEYQINDHILNKRNSFKNCEQKALPTSYAPRDELRHTLRNLMSH